MFSRLGRCTLAVALLLTAALTAPSPAAADSDTSGSEHWLMFQENLGTGTMSLFITGDQAAAGTVSGPSLSPIPFTVTPGEISSIPIPLDMMVRGSGVTEQGIHVTADADVTVYGLNLASTTTDAFLGLPVDILDTEYLLLDTPNTVVHDSDAAQFGIVATQDDTQVTLNFAGDFGGGSSPVDTSVTLNLDIS